MINQISVVMPTYNAMPFLRAAVESILTQSFKDFEFLIVNDGSTDESKDYLDSLSDPRIRVIHLTQRGVETALNTGIRQAKHHWIARMDADDVALPQRLEKQVEFLNLNPEYALVSCAMGYIGQNGRRLKVTQVPKLVSPPIYQPMIDSMITDQGMMFRRDAVLGVGGYRIVGPAEGMDLVLRLDEAGYLMTSTPDVLMLVRVLAGGMSAQKFVEQRVTWKYARACSTARRTGCPEPERNRFFREHWPRGWRRLKVEGARQFRLGGADWGAGHFLRAALRISLALLLRPNHVISKFRTYSFAGAPSAEAKNS
jgi:glycosyltransferase involved in cell wall biosynthesis